MNSWRTDTPGLAQLRILTVLSRLAVPVESELLANWHAWPGSPTVLSRLAEPAESELLAYWHAWPGSPTVLSRLAEPAESELLLVWHAWSSLPYSHTPLSTF